MSLEAKLNFFGDTDVGVRREENQDYWGYFPAAQNGGLGELFIVADGMGGALGGSVASKLAVEGVHAAFRDHVAAHPDGAIFDAIRVAVSTANATIHARSKDPETRGMGTTIVILFISGDLAYTAHVGDSRIYRYRDGRLEQLTRDHTRVQELVDQGIITPGKAKHHPQGHIIARNLGSSPAVDADIPPDGPFRIRDGDIFMLCSDGLYGLVDDEAIRQVLRTAPPEAATKALINLANRKGGHDNITVCTICAGKGQALWEAQHEEVLTSLLDRLALDQTSDTAVFNVTARDALQPTDFETHRITVPRETQLERDIKVRAQEVNDGVGEKPPSRPPSSSSGIKSRAQGREQAARRKPFPWLLVALFVGLVVAILFVIVGIAYLALERGFLTLNPAETTRPVRSDTHPHKASRRRIRHKTPKPVRQPEIRTRRAQVSCSALPEMDEALAHYKLSVAEGSGANILVNLGMEDEDGRPLSCRTKPGSMVQLPRDQGLLHFWLEDPAGHIEDCRAEYTESEPVRVEIHCPNQDNDGQ